MKIQLLYIDDCPSWQSGLENLKTVLQMEGINIPVVLVKVKDNNDANRRKFLGSPSFLVDGEDLWPEERDVYSLSCRVYITPEGIKGWPSVDMLRKKLNAVKGTLS
jgi:hypothetical protein